MSIMSGSLLHSLSSWPYQLVVHSLCRYHAQIPSKLDYGSSSVALLELHISKLWALRLSGCLLHHSCTKLVHKSWGTSTFSSWSETYTVLCLSFEIAPWKPYLLCRFFILSMLPCMLFKLRSQNCYPSFTRCLQAAEVNIQQHKSSQVLL